ncbi:MAG: aminotransferase class III-fold pyridoxal phosphate-dependent enzyme [Bacteroidota bacterium]|nr:aminotransferase class III-fold pyridoxal phosphate-dependent enzyme [Bacteroidota bacterium]
MANLISDQKIRNAQAESNHYQPTGLGELNPRLIISKAHGANLYDTELREYIDFSHTEAHILGHAPERVTSALETVINNGLNQGLATTGETTLVKLIQQVVPSAEQVHLTSSGHKAAVGAIRQALAFTGRKRIIKFKGANHGKFSHLGIPDEFAQLALNLPFNDEVAVFEAFELFKNEIASVIVEPVLTGVGVVLPQEGFLQFLRTITAKHKSLLIFDEKVTGFRPKAGGAQEYFNVFPDVTILGNILGGGYSIGAFAGRRDVLSVKSSAENTERHIDPLAIAAGTAILQRLRLPQFYEPLNHKSRDFIFWLNELTQNRGIQINAFQSMFTLYFNENKVTDFASANRSDRKRYERFSRKAFEQGVLFPQSQFGTNFISSAHLPQDLSKTLDVVYRIIKNI